MSVEETFFKAIISSYAFISSSIEFAGAGGAVSSGHACDLPMKIKFLSPVSEKSSMNCLALCVLNFSVIIAAIFVITPSYLYMCSIIYNAAKVLFVIFDELT